MKRLLTFEAFVPKNIDKRSEDLKRMQAKELIDYEVFIKEFSKNLSLIQGKTSVDEKEQLFINLIKDCDIKLYQQNNPFSIFLLKDDAYMFQYDWKNDILWCSNARVWTVFKGTFKMDYQQYQHFIADQIDTYFNFRPSTTRVGIS